MASYPIGLSNDQVAQLGLNTGTIQLLTEFEESSFHFVARPETVAEFAQFIEDCELSIDSRAALDWWSEHGPTFSDLEVPDRCPRCGSTAIAQLEIAGRPAVCQDCDACVESLADDVVAAQEAAR